MKVGDSFRALVSGIPTYKIHIIAVVDTDYIVYKYFGRHKQWWHYKVEHRDFVLLKIERAGAYDHPNETE